MYSRIYKRKMFNKTIKNYSLIQHQIQFQLLLSLDHFKLHLLPTYGKEKEVENFKQKIIKKKKAMQ